MPQPKKSDRALGPYQHRRKWRVFWVVDGERTPQDFETESEAIEAIEFFRQAVGLDARTVATAIDSYEEWLAEKGTKKKSNKTTLSRLRAFFAPFQHEPIDELTEKKAAKIYKRYRESKTRLGTPPADATHQWTLRETRTFFSWCRDKGWIKGNPFANVKPVGTPNEGKPALRIDECRKLYATCLEDASDGAFAVLTALFMGTRATETVTLTGRDVDDRGTVLWVEGEGTKHAKKPRKLRLPDEHVANWLRRRAAHAHGGRLWPGKDRTWLYREAKRLSKLAGVPPVGAQQLRVSHSVIVQIAGVTAAVVAEQLGHDESVNRAAYSAPGVAEQAQARRVFEVMDGGRSAAG